MILPITPQELPPEIIIPDEVIRAFNELIVKHWNGTHATFERDEVTQMISDRMDIPVDQADGMLGSGIEVIYRRVGWSTTYDDKYYFSRY